MSNTPNHCMSEIPMNNDRCSGMTVTSVGSLQPTGTHREQVMRMPIQSRNMGTKSVDLRAINLFLKANIPLYCSDMVTRGLRIIRAYFLSE
jgi:hypothetical protein